MKTKIPKKDKKHSNDTAMQTVAYFYQHIDDIVKGQDGVTFDTPYPTCAELPGVNPAFQLGTNEDGDGFLQCDVEGTSVLHLEGLQGDYDAEGIPFIGGRPPRDPKKPH